jgi:hypothetical protein
MVEAGSDSLPGASAVTSAHNEQMDTMDRMYLNLAKASDERDMATKALKVLLREVRTGRAMQYIRKEDRQMAEDVLALLGPDGDGTITYLRVQGTAITNPMADMEYAMRFETEAKAVDYWMRHGVKEVEAWAAIARWKRVQPEHM